MLAPGEPKTRSPRKLDLPLKEILKRLLSRTVSPGGPQNEPPQK